MTEIEWTDAEREALEVAELEKPHQCYYVTVSAPPYLRDPDPTPTIEPAEAFTITTAHGQETHHRDAYGQIGHHRAGPDCKCKPEIEEKR